MSSTGGWRRGDSLSPRRHRDRSDTQTTWLTAPGFPPRHNDALSDSGQLRRDRGCLTLFVCPRGFAGFVADDFSPSSEPVVKGVSMLATALLVIAICLQANQFFRIFVGACVLVL